MTYTLTEPFDCPMTFDTVADVYDQVERIAVTLNMWGGFDVHGTKAVAYHDVDYCEGHVVATVVTR